VRVKGLTDEGSVGLGEAWPLTPRAVAAFIVEALRPRLLGADPTRIEALWRKMYQATFRYGRKGLVLNAISRVEIALWDILGKSCGLLRVQAPRRGLLEGIRAYASLRPTRIPKTWRPTPPRWPERATHGQAAPARPRIRA
jgi:L-alanine-DL-glutamate epimerase-like enolase superfamily enzyme